MSCRLSNRVNREKKSNRDFTLVNPNKFAFIGDSTMFNPLEPVLLCDRTAPFPSNLRCCLNAHLFCVNFYSASSEAMKTRGPVVEIFFSKVLKMMLAPNLRGSYDKVTRVGPY